MGKRIVTTDVEIIDAVIKAIDNLLTAIDHNISDAKPLPEDMNNEVNEAALSVVRTLTKPPEKPSDITGFPEDDA